MVVEQKSEHYLIIGGLGYIGAHLANYIHDYCPDAAVILFDRISKNSDICRVSPKLRDSNRYSLIVGDAINEPLLLKTMTDFKIDIIFYCATSGEASDCKWNPVVIARNNIIGFTHTLNAIRAYGKLKKLIYVSSEEVYGKVDVKKTESLILRPESSVSASESGAEAMLNAYFISYRLPLVIARLSQIVFGGNMNTDNYLERFINEADKRKNCSNSSCSVIEIYDAVEGLMACADKGTAGEIYNISANHSVTDEIIGSIVAAVSNNGNMSSVRLLESSMVSDKASKFLNWHASRTSIQSLTDCIRKMLVQKCKAETTKDPLKFLIYGGDEYVARQLIKLLTEKNLNYCVAKRNVGKDADQNVLNEIVSCAPSHVIAVCESPANKGQDEIFLSKGDPGKLRKNICDNLYTPWLLASFCDRLGIHFTYLGSGHIFKYDKEHPIGGCAFKEDDLPNYFGDNISVIKGHADRVMQFFSNTLNARIRLPLGYDRESYDWITKPPEYLDVPESITLLSTCLPILLDMAMKRICGTINLVNPGPIRLSEIAEKYKKLIDPGFQYKILNPEKNEKLLEQRSHCILDTKKLETLYPNVKSATEEVETLMSELCFKTNRGLLHQA